MAAQHSSSENLPILRSGCDDGDWDDQTAPMTMYDYCPPASSSRPLRCRVSWTERQRELAAKLMRRAIRDLREFLSPEDLEEAQELVRDVS